MRCRIRSQNNYRYAGLNRLEYIYHMIARVLVEVAEMLSQPLTPRILDQLSESTESEPLSGKFTATLPPCWNELQPDQQQRKHPQHLQRSSVKSDGDDSPDNVCRTWKLQVFIVGP